MASLQTKYSFILLLLVSLTLQAKGAINFQQTTDSTINLAPEINYESNILLVDSIVNFSKLYLGKPYRGGGKGPNSFDCSGFTSFVFNNFGIKLGSSSSDQAEQVPQIKKEDIQPGDLVFYNGRRRGSRVGHVGMVITKHENGDFDFIHSASSIGISISNSESDYYSRRYVGAGRAVPFDSLIARSTIKQSDYSRLQLSENVSSISSNQINEVTTTVVKKKVPAKYHTVKSGETLSEIASKYGLTITQLKKKNHLKNDFLALKQRLKIKDEYEISVVEKVKPTSIISVDTTKTPAINLEKTIDEKQLSKTHKVKKGETLFSISKEYGISIDALEEWNKLNNGKIFVGQELALSTDTSVETVVKENAETTQKFGTHIVSKGETLQSISKIYKITIAELKAINKLETDNILAGQKLNTPESKSLKTDNIARTKTKTHIVKSGETLSGIAEKYHCTVSELKKWNGKKSTKLSLGEKLKIII